MKRRKALQGFAAVCLASPLCAVAQTTGSEAAAQFPSRPIKVIVGFSPGGTTDILARMYGQRLSQILGQPVVIENRVGASGTIASQFVAAAAPDGYTLNLNAITSAILVTAMGDKLPYRHDDLTGVALLMQVPNVVIVPASVPVRTLSELIALAKSKPDGIAYGSGATGSSTQLTMEYLKSLTGMRLTHVPYKGAAPLITALLSAEVSAAVDAVSTSLPHIRSGRLRALAVTSNVRSALLPDVPTLAEAGVPDFESIAWFGMQAPARTPRPLVDKIGQVLDAISKEPDIRAKLAEMGGYAPQWRPDAGTPAAAFDAFTKAEVSKWAHIVKTTGVKFD